MMMRWLICPFMLALGVRAWQVGPAAQRLAVSSARRAAGAESEENNAADAIAAADAELCAEATRVAWAELEDVRARAARPPCKTPPPNAELLRLVDKLGQSRRYIAYLKLHRTELRRLSTRTVLARRAAEVPLADLAPPLTRPVESPEARAAVDELIREVMTKIQQLRGRRLRRSSHEITPSPARRRWTTRALWKMMLLTSRWSWPWSTSRRSPVGRR